jgi:hypothetical protein
MREVAIREKLPGAGFTAPATCCIQYRQQLEVAKRGRALGDMANAIDARYQECTRPKRRPEIQTFRSRSEGSRVFPKFADPSNSPSSSSECPAGTQGEPSLVRPVQLTRSLEMFASDFMNRVSCLSKICFPHGGSKPFSRKNPADGRRNSTQT